MVLFITIRSFVTGAIVTVYNHAIGPCYLFQLCYLFHDILMKFGGPLAIIVHHKLQFNLECCKSSVSDMGHNTMLKIKKLSYILYGLYV